MSESFGHESIVSFFEQSILNHTLNHAYAFFGPTHVGKRTVADEISRKLLNISPDRSLVHPDFVLIEREIDEKTGSRKKDISVAQIRELIHRMSQSSFEKDGYTVAIIDGAEYLNPAGANGLLKTLEEPRPQTVVFLITQDETLLLPTIRSRVQSFYFSPVSRDRIQSFLLQQGMETDRALELARESHGLPGYACSWASEHALHEAYTTEKQRCTSLLGFQFYEKLHAIEDLFENSDDHIEARGKIVEALRVWTFVLRDIMITNSLTRTHLYPALDAIRNAERDLKRNIHPRLILEHIMLTLPHI